MKKCRILCWIVGHKFKFDKIISIDVPGKGRQNKIRCVCERCKKVTYDREADRNR